MIVLPLSDTQSAGMSASDIPSTIVSVASFLALGVVAMGLSKMALRELSRDDEQEKGWAR